MYTNILIAVDANDPATWGRSTEAARKLATCFGAQLTICSILPDSAVIAGGQWWPIAYRQHLATLQAQLEELASSIGAGRALAAELGTGTICSGIVEVAERIGADLIILSSHRPGFKDHLFAANAARVARRANCSVLVVREHASGQGDAITGATENLGENPDSALPLQ